MTLKNFPAPLLILLVIFSCREDGKQIASHDQHTTAVSVARNYHKTDTVRFTSDRSRVAVIGLSAPGAYDKDSNRVVTVDVLYFKNGKQVSSITDTFYGRGEEELSYYFEGSDSNGNSCERFFTVNYGYPACGYNQSHLTFFADSVACALVCKHNSFADGAYGGGLEFFDLCSPQRSVRITSAEVNREPVEEHDDMLHVTYCDSTEYRYDGKKWTAKLLTEKGKVYRSAKETF